MVLNLRTELATAEQAYLDNASYAEDADLAKAKAFVTACRKLMLLLSEMTRQGARFDQRLGVNLEKIAEERQRAEDWVADQAGSANAGAVRAYSLQNFR